MLNRAFNKQRVRVMKQYPHSTYEYNIFKCFWKLFLVDYALLDHKIPKYRRNLKTFLTDAQIVSEALTLNDELFLSYEIVHHIHNYIINHDVLNLTRFFNKFEELKQNLINARRRWTLENKNRDYPLKLRKLDNYIIIALHTLTSKTNKQGVLNACSKEYQQFNNGGIEGINRRIKLTEREGFGITNFDHLRKRLILQINYRVERKKESKKIK